MRLNSRHLIAAALVTCAAGMHLAGWRSPAEATGEDPTPVETTGQASTERVEKLILERHYAEAGSLASELLAEAEKDHGPDSLEAASAIDLLVLVYHRSGGVVKPADLMELAERAIHIKEALLGQEHEGLIPSLKWRARLLYDKGYIEEALLLLRRALKIAESRYGPDSLEVADSLNGLASVIREAGDPASARIHYERALTIVESSFAPKSEIPGLRFNYAVLLVSMGDYEAARSIFEALAKRRRADADPGQVGGAMCTFGNLLRMMGEYETARPMIERGLDLLKQAGARHPSVAWGLISLADLLQDTGDQDAAGQLYEEALAIKQERFAPVHPNVADSLRRLGVNLLLRGDLERAGQRLEAARTVQEEVFGASHIQLAQTHVALARLHWAAGRSRQAFESALRAEEVSREHFRETSQLLSEREALRYELMLAAGFDTAFTALLALDRTGGAAGLTATIWGDLIGSRAMVLDEMAQRHRTVMSLPSSASGRSLLSDLAAARNRLSRLQVSEAPTAEPSDYRESLRQAQADKDRLERAVAAEGGRLRRQDKRPTGLGEVAAVLPDSGALVAYLRFDRVATQVGQRAVPSYVALVQRQGARDPVVVALGEAERMDRLIQQWRQAVGADPRLSSAGTAEAAYLEIGSRLREAAWDPVAASLPGVKQAFIVPDGALNFVNFGALPVDGRQYLVETGPTLHYLSAERDLLRASGPRRKGEGLLAMGAPDFDAAAVDASPMAPTQAPSSPSVPSAAIRRNARASCEGFGSIRFGALPGSGVEVDRIASIWRERANGRDGGDNRVIQLTGTAAGEAAFKRLAPGRKIVHLATHGFLGDGTCESNRSALIGRRSLDLLSAMPPHRGDSPLLLSGLALAGANRRGQIGADTDAEDGVLTAEEIGSLDLSHTEWAVLSACETGLGRLMSGEGVLGLRRAFEVAGAGTLIMSLWQVEDDATRVWMGRLYEGRLAGLSTSAAMRQASLGMIEDQRRRGATTHPFFWGGFVAAGDWR